MAQFSRIAAVTGANKGIGLAIVRNLALQYPSSAFNNGPLLIYLCARDIGKGKEAVTTLEGDAQLKKAKALAQAGGLTTVKFHKVDINSGSMSDFAGFLEKEHPEGIDMVINNAGIAMEGFNIDVVKQTLGCNYYGTLDISRALLPLIRPGGRLVNLASMVGHLNSKYSAEIRTAFAESKTVEDVTALMKAFTKAVEEGKENERGWPSMGYAVSKSGIVGMTRALALEEKEKGSGVLVNSCCPGFVKTDMTRQRGQKTVDEGAQTPVLLACGDIGGTTGEFWQHEEVIEW
ncbi:MAG: hypothetical protein ALECFALPRED_008294 [Alectoria fallacina]|uniref:Carbonyl reductase n=1 Tax=Alectoria fallacina TaxID=1903189 RepID=A0A8H3EYU7_9LECA|nr:MAG: hypothetical protein ALECFALPRED_008294 [Alectoria fallacina]